MKRFDKRVLYIYLLIATYLLITCLIDSKIINYYTYLINPLVWISFGIASFFLFYDEKTRFNAKKDKLQIVFIFTLIYIIIYFLSGLIFDFTKNIYSLQFFNILKNIFAFIIVIIAKEYIRNILVINSGKSYKSFVIITLIMSLSDIVLFNLPSLMGTSESAFKYFFQAILPTISLNAFCTYLSTTTDFVPAIIYRSFITIVKITIPIQPNLDWFMAGMLDLLYPGVMYFFVNNFNVKKNRIIYRRRINKRKIIPEVIFVIFLIIFGFFVGGFFSIAPVAVLSSSMDPVFSRGDVVFVHKIDKENMEKLKKYDIIKFRIDGKVVLHRIVDIEKTENGELLITTKGDNNESADSKKITTDQIDGIIKGKIKYIGYPSVLLYDYFNK
ncbi:MAG: signal peptidase I [Bacilli bacterium]